ncbi:GNAT family N-acetyltransferase [Humibacter soli]
MDVVIRAATLADAAAIAEMMSRAFHDDPVMRWVVPHAAGRPRRLRRLYEAIVRHEGIPMGATDVAVREGVVVGAAVWRPPRRRMTPWRAVPFALSCGWTLGTDIPRMTAMGRSVFREHPREPHWYLQLLAVDPEAQGSGAGTELVRRGLERVDRDGTVAYLETTQGNLAFYERLGFPAVGEIAMPRGCASQFRLLRSAR